MEHVYAISEQLSAVPWTVLCVATCWDYLRWKKSAAVVCCVLFTAWLALCGFVCASLGWSTNFTLVPSCLIASAVLMGISRFSGYKTFWLVASAAYLGAFVTYMAIVVDAYVVGDTLSDAFLAWPGMAVQWGLGVLCVVLLWRPMRHKLPAFLAEESYGKFWRYAWLLPMLCTAEIVLAVPVDTATLLVRRVGYLAVVAITVQLALVALTYGLGARLIALSAERIHGVEENRQLAVALQQTSHQQERIDEARRARHDMRHHLHVIASLLREGNNERVLAYLADIEDEAVDASRIICCDNDIVGSLAAYYLGRAQAAGARIETRLDLPKSIGISDTDLAVIVGNLLENAAQAVERDARDGRQPRCGAFVTAKAQLVNGTMLVFVCDNSCVSTPASNRSGGFASHPDGSGIGISSVRAAVERNGGTVQFEYSNEVFTSSVVVQCG